MRNIIFLLIFLSFYSFSFSNLYSKTVYVKVTNLRVRENPSTKSKIIAYITENDAVEIIKKSKNKDTIVIRKKKITDNWYNIKTLAGIEGWVFGGTLEKSKKIKLNKIKSPKIIGFGEAQIWRSSKNKNPRNKTWSLPPWETVEIIGGSYYLSKPIIGKKITLISK